jgi:hypothetical protein
VLHPLILLAVLLHGIGHAVGFWMAVPSWFVFAWLLLGVGFLAGAWGFWQLADWSPAVLVVSAAASLLMLALISVTNTFFWSCWTFVYVRLRTEGQADALG